MSGPQTVQKPQIVLWLTSPYPGRQCLQTTVDSWPIDLHYYCLQTTDLTNTQYQNLHTYTTTVTHVNIMPTTSYIITHYRLLQHSTNINIPEYS